MRSLSLELRGEGKVRSDNIKAAKRRQLARKAIIKGR